MAIKRCPHCKTKWYGYLPTRMLGWIDDENPLTYGLSRREPVKVCTICTKSEALSDMQGSMLTDEQARIAIGNDHQEAIRLPPGLSYGIFGIATGGFDEWIAGWEEAYGVKN
jgi:hypothetical protein